MNIGCHCVLYGPAIATDTDRVLGDLAKAGCRGVELGARFFNIDHHAELKEALEQHGLVLAGLHQGVPLVQLLDAPEESFATLAAAAKSLAEMPIRNVIMTGNVDAVDDVSAQDSRLAKAEGTKKIAVHLDEIAERLLNDYGVQLHYHNHNWEFQNDGLIYRALLSETKKLHMCLDTGWAISAGFDPVEIIRSKPGHFSYIHLRDYDKQAVEAAENFKQMQTVFVDLGEGDMDYRHLAGCARDVLGEDGWAMIEYEKGEADALRYVKAVAYLNGVLQGIG